MAVPSAMSDTSPYVYAGYISSRSVNRKMKRSYVFTREYLNRSSSDSENMQKCEAPKK